MVIQAVEFDMVGVPAHHGRMPDTSDTTKKPKKRTSVRQTRATQPDRSERPDAPPPGEQIAERLNQPFAAGLPGVLHRSVCHSSTAYHGVKQLAPSPTWLTTRHGWVFPNAGGILDVWMKKQ
jgi:hypothetical protein